MQINIKATGSVMLTDEIRSFIEEKLARIEKLLDAGDTTRMADVEVGSVSNSRTGDLFRAEINLTFAGGMIRAEASRETLHSAVDEAVDEARREMRRMRVKHRDLVRRGAAKVKDFFKYFQGE